jgi:hypothetical protein
MVYNEHGDADRRGLGLPFWRGGTRPPGLMIRLGVDLIYLVAKLPLMGDDVKGLCCHLH